MTGGLPWSAKTKVGARVTNNNATTGQYVTDQSSGLSTNIFTLEPRRYRPEDCLMEGEPPSPIDLPPGCAYAARCPHAFDRCRAENPALLARGSDAFAACFLIGQAAAPAQNKEMTDA